MANFLIPEVPQWDSEIRKFETSDPAHADLFNEVIQTLLNNEVYLLKAIQEAGKNSIKIGPADTELDAGDTLFVVEGMPGIFKAAAYNNVFFGEKPPANGYWADMMQPEVAAPMHKDGVLITSGKLAVSKEQDAPDDTAFLAKIDI